MINLDKYKTIVFDFDGVILDSNNIKKNAIAKAVEGVLSDHKASEFVDYFVRFNGMPREYKIEKYVPKEKYQYVLNKYENLIDKKLKSASLIPGINDFLNTISKFKKKMIVLSGGSESEVLQILKDRKLAKFFEGVYGGPKNKDENLQGLCLVKPVLYFGDSEVDYSISQSNNFDFVFVYGASNILDWKSETRNWNLVKSINDFSNKD